MTLPVLVQSADGGNVGAVVPTLGATPTPGNLLLLWLNATDVTSGSAYTGFTLVAQCDNINGGTNRHGALLYRVVQPGDTTTIVPTDFTSGKWSYFLQEWSGATIDGYVTQSSTAAAGTMPPLSGEQYAGGAITPTNGIDAVILGFAIIRQGSGENLIVSSVALSGQTQLFGGYYNVSDARPVQVIAELDVSGTSGAYTVGSFITLNVTSPMSYGGVTVALAGGVTALSPGGLIEFDPTDGFVDVGPDVVTWTITRGASPELTGGSNPGSATILLKNTDDNYNPENASGPYYGLLHDGPRVWLGINEDGTLAYDAAKDVYGLHAGRITDLSVIPGEGTATAPFVEIVTEDPLGWFSRQSVRLADSETRSHADLRLEVLTALGVASTDLPPEPTTMPLSSADGLALNILDGINQANGTRHFAKPAPDSGTWYTYTAIRRTDRLDGTFEASIDAGADHVTGTSGWRTSADGVINRQKATVAEVSFPAKIVVWQADTLPIRVTSTAPVTIWATFGDYVKDPVTDSTATGSALTVTITPFGDTAKVVLTSSGTSTVTALDIRGYLVQRGSDASVVIDDAVSQAKPRGVRAGPDLTGDYLGTLTGAEGFARHIVWRFGNELYRPTMTVANWFPEMFVLDIGDRIAFTSSQLGLTDRIFEIAGLTHVGLMAALDADGNPVVHHTVTYTLQESRVQTSTDWFILDASLLDGTDILAY